MNRTTFPPTLASLGISPSDMLNLQANQNLASNDLTPLQEQIFGAIDKVQQDLANLIEARGLKRKVIDETPEPKEKAKLQKQLEEQEKSTDAYKSRVLEIVTSWQGTGVLTPRTMPSVGVVRQPVMSSSGHVPSISSTSDISSSSSFSTSTAASQQLTLTPRWISEQEKKMVVLNSACALVDVMENLSIEGFKQWLESTPYQLFSSVYTAYRTVKEHPIDTFIKSEKPIDVRRQCLLMFLRIFKTDLTNEIRSATSARSPTIWNRLSSPLESSIPPGLLSQDVIVAFKNCEFDSLEIKNSDQYPVLEIVESTDLMQTAEVTSGFNDFKSIVENPSQGELETWIKKFGKFENLIFADEANNEMLFFSIIDKFGKCDNDNERETIKRLYRMINVKKLPLNNERGKTDFPLGLVSQTLKLINGRRIYFINNFSNAAAVITAWELFEKNLNEIVNNIRGCISKSSIINAAKWCRDNRNVMDLIQYHNCEIIQFVITALIDATKTSETRNRRIEIYNLLIDIGCYQISNNAQQRLDVKVFLSDRTIHSLARDENKMYQFLSGFENAMELFMQVKKRISSNFV